MIQKVLVTPIIGLPQVNGWAQVMESSHGRLICSFSISGSDAGNVGRDLVDLIQNQTLEGAASVYALIKKTIRFTSEKACDLQLAVGFFDGEQTVFAAYNGALLLKRNDKVGTILHADDELKIIEGKMADDDIFVFLTNTALEFKGEIFQKLTQGLDADTIAASIVPGVQNLTDSSLVSLAFVVPDTPQEYVSGYFEAIEAKTDTDIQDEAARESDAEDSVEVESETVDVSEPSETVPLDTPDQPTSLIQPPGTSVFVSNIPAMQKKAERNWQLDINKIINPDKLKTTSLVVLKKIARKGYVLGKRSVILTKKVFSGGVYVSKDVSAWKKKLKLIPIFLMVIALLVAPVVYFRIKSANQVKAAQASIEEHMTQFAQAKSEVEAKPIESREVLAGVIENLKAKQKTFANQRQANLYIGEKIAEVESFYDSVSGKEEFNSLDTFFDFGLVESDFVAHKVDLVGDSAFFFDMDKKEIVKLSISNKSFDKIDLSQLQNIKDMAYDDEFLYAVDDGVWKRSLESDGQLEKVIDAGTANRETKLMSVFGGNLYLLNTEQRNIFKYSYDTENDEYFDPVRWVRSAKDLTFEQVSAMEVDGQIWLATKDGLIFNLSAGEGQILDVKGLSEPFESQLSLYTNPDSEQLYILEPAQSRLVVLGKNGEFIKEVKSVSLSSASNLVVSEAENKILIISGSLVFEVAL